jgi:hypothetical protein
MHRIAQKAIREFAVVYEAQCLSAAIQLKIN